MKPTKQTKKSSESKAIQVPESAWSEISLEAARMGIPPEYAIVVLATEAAERREADRRRLAREVSFA